MAQKINLKIPNGSNFFWTTTTTLISNDSLEFLTGTYHTPTGKKSWEFHSKMKKNMHNIFIDPDVLFSCPKLATYIYFNYWRYAQNRSPVLFCVINFSFFKCKDVIFERPLSSSASPAKKVKYSLPIKVSPQPKRKTPRMR